MNNFTWAIKKLNDGYKVRRPSWEKDSYWTLGRAGVIKWKDGTNAHVHLNQITAKDWEIYKIRKLLLNTNRKEIYELAEWLHNKYEQHAKYYSWETQKKCQVKFNDLPKENKEVMRAMAKDILLFREEAIRKLENTLSFNKEKSK